MEVISLTEIMNKREACQRDYSQWLSTIPDQLGWSIAEGNRMFKDLKSKCLKRLAKKHGLSLETVTLMFSY